MDVHSHSYGLLKEGIIISIVTINHSHADTELGTSQAWNSTVDEQDFNKEEESTFTRVVEETKEKPTADSKDVLQMDTFGEEGNGYECPQDAKLVESN